ncbi:hypothetical protein BHE97_11680 [Aeromicrobium sp. PE09-221]|uniref:LLM class flavin-dependent oxidoreductase n=1 Tax=Aeromicrobium sp. PE09-221 TaxID=1898043 RepID=UPI000B6A2E39|nr:LLM class flavin-dependent oxidoreductase [Aeromicrobium sp. PE09-221]OUZ09148.1 hypothetical protein BHE97_11680 [Aeromicrobium sp. PE09-221]
MSERLVLDTSWKRWRHRTDLPRVRDERPRDIGAWELVAHARRAAEAVGIEEIVVLDTADGLSALAVVPVGLRATQRTRWTVELTQDVATPVYTAKLSASLQRFSAGRLAWRIDPRGWRGRHDVIEEFVTVARGVWRERPYDFSGEHFRVQGGGLDSPLSGRPLPPLEIVVRDEDDALLASRVADRIAVETLDPDSWPDLGLPLAARVSLASAATSTEVERLSTAEVVGTYDAVAGRLAPLSERATWLDLDVGDRVEEIYRWGEHVAPRIGALIHG